ncbi:MAG: ChbG/HpnK family deacetylase [Candidatus Omnitrophota bacterium]
MTKGINQGIIESFHNGPIRSASIMAVGRAYDHAVALLKENPKLDTGIHLCLTEEKPVLEKEEIATLTGKGGYFLQSHKKFLLHYFMGKIGLGSVRRELDAQIRKVLESGINITHIDSHGHIHVLPGILRIVAELAKRYRIPFIRYPRERLKTLDVKFSRRMQSLILNILCSYSKQRFEDYDIAFFGFFHSGRISRKSLSGILKAVNNGISEIVCHPGICDRELEHYRHWEYQWEEELNALTSQDISKIINGLNIEVVSFSDILC